MTNLPSRLFNGPRPPSSPDGCNDPLRPVRSPGWAVAAHLQRARDALCRPGAWTQDHFATGQAGVAVDSRCSQADRFCCSGALFMTACADDRTVLARIILQKVVRADIEVWNDMPGRQHREVLAAFDRAIALAKRVKTEPSRPAPGGRRAAWLRSSGQEPARRG